MNGIRPCVANEAVATAAAAFPDPRMPTYFESPTNRWTFWTPCEGLEALSSTSTTTLRPLMPPRAFQYATNAWTVSRSPWPTTACGPVSGESMPR